ncbi:hypothetical protein [Streptomyces sp. PR69]|uniref:hypothetical protein n=1 Tax=Streptomyces sp. PR69 TaxID=2984950 RepID=UPI0022647EA2|nr:hypothetical protein [Streptomyces sp. PR69]
MPQACETTEEGCQESGGGFGFGDLFDIPGMIVNAITSFLGMLIEQIMKPVREFLADTLLATPDVTQHADVRRLWTAILGITAGIYVVFVTAGGITIMGYETFQTRYTLQQVAPRLLLGMIASATSLTVMGKAISLANALAHAIMATDMTDAGKGMVERVLPFALFGTAGLKIYLLILAILMIALVLAVLVGFLVRVAVMALLAVGAPLMLACHAHPLTDPVARLWWRALGGCLAIQVAQSMTFILALKLFFAPGATTLGIPKSDQLGTMLAGLALFWVLFKIPGWTLQVVLRGTPAHQPHAPASVRVLKHLALYQLMNRYVPGVSTLRRHPTGRSGGGGGGGIRGGPGLRPGGPPSGGGRPAGSRGRPGGGGRPGGSQGGRPGGGRPPAPVPAGGPGPGVSVRSRARALFSRSRAILGPARTHLRSPAARWSIPGGRGSGNSTMAANTAPTAYPDVGPTGASRPSRARVARRPSQGPAPAARTPGGPRSVIHPAQARRTRQLSLPVPAKRAPTRPARSTQMWLPISVQRIAAAPPPTPARPTASAPSAPASAPVPRARQLALPVPAARVRRRPPRPMQLRLPLEPPRRHRP